MTLTEFLLEQIAADEADVEGHAFDYTYQDTGVSVCRHESHPSYSATCWRAIVRPRVLAECESKRRIVELEWHHFGDSEFADGMEYAKDQILKLLALPYADHPDYDEAWRP